MIRMRDSEAEELGLRVIETPTTPLQQVRLYDATYGRLLEESIQEAMIPYVGQGGKFQIKAFTPVPRPDYEIDYGGPYSHILTVKYRNSWEVVFGVRVDGKLVLWMD